MSIWAEAGSIISSLIAGDPFTMKSAFRANGAWLVFGAVTAIGAVLVAFMYRRIPFLDRHLERAIIVYTYLAIAAIIFVGVIQRFVLSGQPPWSTTIPPLLFMIMAWFGCSYNVRLRTHLSFNEFRVNMPRPLQLGCLMLDAALWFGFCVIVVTTTARVTVNSIANFQIVLGTDNTMQWWFIVTVPFAFILMAGRVLENLLEDLHNYRTGEPLIRQAVIGGDTG
ncbi:TRAP transporter small permease [Aliiroseovarius sp. YM-037]|uniref:TRAP transporter small permease n=1 Tax=Aliiroseovarius sp. YM-037 TaxID=3341728 RepID=UPI003A8032F1